MPSGRVKWFDPTQHYGFITPDEGGPDVFVHEDELRTGRPLDEGETVVFEIKTSPKGPIAIDVHHRPTD